MIKRILFYIKEKSSHPGIKKHTKNIGWMMLAKIGGMTISFIATAYIARNLGPINYGELSYAISFVMLFSFIASFGIDQILYRDIILYPNKKNELLGSAIALRLITSTFSIIITSIAVFLFSPRDVSFFLIFIISTSSLFGSFQLLSYEFQAEVKAKYTSILILIVTITLNIFKIMTIYFGGGIIYLATIVILEPIFYSVGYLYLKNKIFFDLHLLKYTKETTLRICKDSYPLIFASAFYVIYSRIDQVMLKNMVNAKAVGLYDAAVRMSEVFYFIPQIILMSLFTVIINSKKESNELYNKRSRKLFFFLVFLSFIIAITTTLISDKLIRIVFGQEFNESISIFNIYIWSNVGAVLNMISQQILVSENMTKYISITTFFGMTTNVLLNLILIPIYGPHGAAVATLISYCIPFLSMLFFKKTRHLIKQVIF